MPQTPSVMPPTPTHSGSHAHTQWLPGSGCFFSSCYILKAFRWNPVGIQKNTQASLRKILIVRACHCTHMEVRGQAASSPFTTWVLQIKDQTQVVRLGRKHLDPLSHLAHPQFFSFLFFEVWNVIYHEMSWNGIGHSYGDIYTASNFVLTWVSVCKLT